MTMKRPLSMVLSGVILFAVSASELRGEKRGGKPTSYRIDRSSDLERAEQRYRRIMEQPVRWKFVETLLSDWTALVSQKYDLPLVLDRRALESAGIGTDQPITMQLPEMSLRSAIDFVLRDLELTMCVERDYILITTKEVAHSQISTRIYPVWDLVRVRSRGRKEFDAQALIDVIQNTTGKPDPGWIDDGGVGTVEQMPNVGSLAISATAEVHEQIEGVLVALRKARAVTRVPTFDARNQYSLYGWR